MSEHELSFRCMGTGVRLVGPDRAALEDAREWLDSFDRRLSRFRPDSELCALNADPREAVPVSALLRTAIGVGLRAARTTGGLVDPTVLPRWPGGLRRLAGRRRPRRPGGRARRGAAPAPGPAASRARLERPSASTTRPAS